jgi:DNA replication protein DnaC
MSVRLDAEKNILKRKLHAEEVADRNLNTILKDENVKLLFLKCKKLVVDIAKIEVSGKRATKEREEYNSARELMAEVLKSMGIDKSDLRPKYTCPLCKDMGYVGGKTCECLKKEISLELIKQSGIDFDTMAQFNDDYSLFDNPGKSKIIYEKMKKFVEEIDNTAIDNVLIMGNTGVGKTHLMECMATYAVLNSRLIKYSTAFNFNQDMLKFHCAKVEEKSGIMDNYINCEILFLDDLGTENKINNVTNEYLYSIINERMQNHKKTVITTNLDFSQIQDVYGERIFSRLVHKKHSLKINFIGSDLRVKK